MGGKREETLRGRRGERRLMWGGRPRPRALRRSGSCTTGAVGPGVGVFRARTLPVGVGKGEGTNTAQK